MSRRARRFPLLPVLALLVVGAWGALAAWILFTPLSEDERFSCFDPRETSGSDSAPSFAAAGLLAHYDVRDGSSWALSAVKLEQRDNLLRAWDLRLTEKRSRQPIVLSAQTATGVIESNTRTGSPQVSCWVLSGSVEVRGPGGRQLLGPEMQLYPDRMLLASSQTAWIRFASGAELQRLSWFQYNMTRRTFKTNIAEGRGLLRALQMQQGDEP